MNKLGYLGIIFLLIIGFFSGCCLGTEIHNFDAKTSFSTQDLLPITHLPSDTYFNQNNISFDIQVREQNGNWQDENITVYVGTILEFKIRIETNRGYPFSLTAVISLPTTDNGTLFEFIDNSETSSKKPTLFEASDEDVLFVWFPLLRPSTITCTFLVRTQQIGTHKEVESAGIGLIDENLYDIKNDSLNITSIIPPNPDTPDTPQGPVEGFVHDNYTYTAFTIDPYDKDLLYRFNWGDGSYSNWIGPVASGTLIAATHSWETPGSYAVRVKAKNEDDFESSWSNSLVVSISEKITVTKPIQGVYLANERVFNFPIPFIIGNIEVQVSTPGIEQVEKVEFHINNQFKERIETEPFNWLWKESFFGSFNLKISVYDINDTVETVTINGFKIF